MAEGFIRDRSWLSNFYLTNIRVKGEDWRSAEHLYQAMKTGVPQEREAIRILPSPGQAKRNSKQLTIRPEWEEIKLRVMEDAVHLKFYQNPVLLHWLVDTGEEHLVEVNWWHDNFWGDCSCPDCTDIAGENMLGKILMEVRSAVQQGVSLQPKREWQW